MEFPKPEIRNSSGNNYGDGMTKKLAIIISLMVLFILVGVGIYLALGKKGPVSPQTQIKKLTEIQVTNWKTYSNKTFSLRYPMDWQISDQKIPVRSTWLETTSISSPSSAVITIQSNTIEQNIKSPLNLDAMNKLRFTPEHFSAQKEINVDGRKLNAYTNKDDGPLINYLVIPVLNKAGDYYEISFGYTRLNPNINYPELFDKIIKTLNFK